MRKVNVSKYQSVPQENGRSAWSLKPAGEAAFHGWGVTYEQYENGPGHFTAAIVEWPDGKVELVSADHIQFVAQQEGPLEQRLKEVLAFEWCIEEVSKAFDSMRSACPYTKQASPDCGHPEQDFNCVVCCPANCPLLLED